MGETPMRRRYFLFANEDFGAPFEAAFRAWCAENAAVFYVVRSARRRSRPSGARAKLRAGAIRLRDCLANFAAARSDRVLRSEDVNGLAFEARLLGRGGRNVGIVAGFNQIFRAPTIERFAALYNFHPSVLPLYRGPVPSHWCIANGERQSGITLHEVAPEIDAGAILWQASHPIATRDAAVLDTELAALGAALLPDLLDHLHHGTPLPEGEKLDARELYEHPIDYRSFPRDRRGRSLHS